MDGRVIALGLELDDSGRVDDNGGNRITVACAGSDRFGRCLHCECQRQGVATLTNLSVRAPERGNTATAAIVPERIRAAHLISMLPRVHVPHVGGAPGFGDEHRLFHLTAVVSQNGFQLSSLAMSDRLFALRLFARVARKGSFSAAGRELNIPQSTASRTIATLEREIGVALFVRTTRAITLTDAGLDFLARIESVLAELDEAEHAARGTGELRGILRIGLGTNFAMREVIPRLSDFMSRHPALRIDLMMGDEREDLVAEGVDVALRFGPLSDSTATVRRILAWPRVLAASRAYLDKAGAPLTPADLAQHAIILGPASLSGHWSFRKGDTATSFQVEGKLTIRASLGAIAAAVEGLGILMTPLGACRRELERGELVRLLPEWDAGTVELNAVYASGRAAKPSARAFVDYLIAALHEAEPPPSSPPSIGEKPRPSA
jgi:DNA-binding transcriptional LysR family regulator